MPDLFADPADDAIPLTAVAADGLAEALAAAPAPVRAQAEAQGFRARTGETVIAPTGEGGRAALIGVGEGDDPFALGAAPWALPDGVYTLTGPVPGADPDQAALAWTLGAYRFGKYKGADRSPARLAPVDGADPDAVSGIADAVRLARDLINTPANDMGPKELEEAADAMIDAHRARARVTVGDMLIQDNYPLIHAVGRGAPVRRAPRILEFEWGREDAPAITVVGKGVCFDTGGLNIKTGDFMRLMKKDMGGAANALALAHMIMAADLDVRLRVLIAAVENTVDGTSFRPGDVLRSRAGLTVEIENTDAEGRLILADALTRATEFDTDLIIDFATLTGAARVALGPELAPFYASDDAVAAELSAAGEAVHDPVWRMPLWDGYDADIESPIADLKNLGAGPMGGSITAALFLRRFTKGRAWVHFDIFAWNPKARPGRPAGGEAQGARAAFAMLAKRYPPAD